MKHREAIVHVQAIRATASGGFPFYFSTFAQSKILNMPTILITAATCQQSGGAIKALPKENKRHRLFVLALEIQIRQQGRR
jgi:hypothetical protein